jgi:PEP-CTERM motif-containing protein
MQFTATRLVVAFTACTALTSAVTLTDNLSKTTGPTELIGGDTWISVAFLTDNANYQISSAALLLSSSGSSAAELDRYSAASGKPAQLLSTLMSPASFPSVPSVVSFTGSSYILSPNSTYWLVLKATLGSFDWSWTSDNTGTGVGFLSQWGATDDAGTTWFTADSEPMQLRVLADPVAPAVPEPGSFTLAALSMAAVIGALRVRKQFLLSLRRSVSSPGPSSRTSTLAIPFSSNARTCTVPPGQASSAFNSRFTTV